MPYKDPEKQREAMRKIMRRYRRRKRYEKLLNDRVRSHPDYQKLTANEKKELDQALLNALELIDKFISDKEVEAKEYVKLRINQWANELISNLERLRQLGELSQRKVSKEVRK